MTFCKRKVQFFNTISCKFLRIYRRNEPLCSPFLSEPGPRITSDECVDTKVSNLKGRSHGEFFYLKLANPLFPYLAHA